MDDTNGNGGAYAAAAAQRNSAAASIGNEVNGNANQYQPDSGNMRMKSLNRRTRRGEIRITENPIAETIVC